MFYYIYHFTSFSLKDVDMMLFLQAKLRPGAKIISNLKQSLSQNFPGKVFNNQLELIQGFGSPITDFFLLQNPKNKSLMDLSQGSLEGKESRSCG